MSIILAYGKRIDGLREAGRQFKPTKPVMSPKRLKCLLSFCLFQILQIAQN